MSSPKGENKPNAAENAYNIGNLYTDQSSEATTSQLSSNGHVGKADDDTYEKDGVANTLHGIEYQIKLLFLIMIRGLSKNYKFRIAAERKQAGKFDDVEVHLDVQGEWKCRFIQAKHRQDETNKITAGDLKNLRDAAFSLKKYFVSYREMKQNHKPGELKNLIIFTNIDLDNELSKNFEQLNDVDDILNISNKRGKHYKLKLDSFFKKDISDILKDASEVKLLTKELVDCIKNGKQFNKKKPILAKYHTALAKTVIDVKGQKLKLDDFKTEIPNYLYEHLEEFKDKTINVPKTFGENEDMQSTVDTLPNDEITDSEIDDFFDKLIFAVDQPNESELIEIIAKSMQENDGDENIKLEDVSLEINQVYTKLKDWIQAKTGTYLTNEICEDMLKNMSQKISKKVLIGLKAIICQEIAEYDIEFEGKLTALQEFLKKIKFL
jgi:hypothetical protein